MLEVKTRSASPPDPTIELASVWRSARSRPRLVLAPVAVALLLSVAFLAVTQSRYRSTVVIAIDPKIDGSLTSRPVVSDGHADSAIVESELEILRSPEVARAVVSMDSGGIERALAPPVAQGASNIIARWIARLTPMPVADLPNLERTVESLRRRIDASRIRSTHVVTVTADMPDPQLAATVANAYAQAYLAARTVAQREVAAHASRLLRERAEELQQQALAAEMAVENARVTSQFGDRDAAAAKVRLRTLESTAKTYRALHDKLLEEHVLTHLASLGALPRARIVSAAREPVAPYWPRRSFVLAAGLVIGLAAGVLVVVVAGGAGRARRPADLA